MCLWQSKNNTKQKHTFKVQLLCILISSILAGCTPRLKFILDDTELLEYGNDPVTLIKEHNADKILIEWKENNQRIEEENLKTGIEYTLVFTVKKNNYIQTFEKKITLIDTEAPSLNTQEIQLILEYGEAFDFNRWFYTSIRMQDNYSLQNKLIIEGLDSLNSEKEGLKIISIMDESRNKTELKVTIVLQDTTAPLISAKRTEFTVYENEQIPDFLSYVSAYDLKDKETEVSIEGSYSIDSYGTYTLYFTSVDSSGNKAELPFNFIVKQKKADLSSDSIVQDNEPVYEDSNKQTTEDFSGDHSDIEEDWFIQDKQNLDACIASGKQSGSNNWECISNGDTTYTLIQYD